MSGKRRRYTPEFREQAARLVIETGHPVAVGPSPKCPLWWVSV